MTETMTTEGTTMRRGVDPCAGCEPIGAKEIGELLDVQANTVHIWRYRSTHGRMDPPMPEPRWHLSNQPIWSKRDIEVWARISGRWPEHLDVAAARRRQRSA